MVPIGKWVKGLLSPVYEKWREKGRRDGLEWATSRATARELEYAATVFKTQKEWGRLVSYDPTKDEVIGAAIVSVFERYHFSWEETEPYTYIPAGSYREWEQGFADAVREYWEQIKK